MNRPAVLRLSVAAVIVALVGSATIASAAPTCTIPETRPACGGRVVAPPLRSTTFLQYATEYKSVLDAIEGYAPEYVDVDNIGDLIGQPDAKSFGGREIYVTRITDESVTTPKRQVAISLSVHGNESAGREGGIRYIDDLATWAKTDPDHLLYAGDVAIPLSEILRETEIYIADINVDGWASGDAGYVPATQNPQPPGFNRGNGRGVDLNRDFPTIGWTKRDQLSEPETRAWEALVSSFPNLTTGSDIHGELTSATDSFADIMYPAGQWDARQQAQELQFAQNMERTVTRKFAEEGVVLQQLFDARGEERPMKPAAFATAFDIVGYDDSGFMGDWFVREGAVELDVENFLSHTVPNNVWFGPLEQAHVAAVKGEIESVITESMITGDVLPDLDIGRVAYVFDPRRVERTEPAEGELAYSASRMDYFEDLEAITGEPIDALAAADVAEADLDQYDTIVLADELLPPDPEGRDVDIFGYALALEHFTQEGGQLLLTDGALELLDTLGGDDVDEAAIGLTNFQGGKVDFGPLDHPWEAGLGGIVNQTFYGVPLGYRSSSSIRESPNYAVDAGVWDALGGVTVGTVNSGADVNLGQLDYGNGSIAIFGSILPTQTQVNRHQFGLSDYAVTVTGGEVLNTILEYRRPVAAPAQVAGV